MAELVRRLQILLDDERHARLEREAKRTGAPVAALVRHAIDRVYPPDQSDRQAAVHRLLAASPMPVEDWAVMKQQMRDELSDPAS
ncbi:MAG TPA: hypothetical protein VM324_04400 [Egibacteraceae bacterium]|nr:hypothetical protein [Egibacteraceae bacterium]